MKVYERADVNSSNRAQKFRGFTIVELLVVILVIGILAAISVVAYKGVTSQARETALKSDLRSAEPELYRTKKSTGSFPNTADTLKTSNGTQFAYSATKDTFCLEATNSQLKNTTFYITESGSIQKGNCPPPPPTMQAFTASRCASLQTFTGANNSAILTLTDSRGGVERSYRVAKLADGKCWMLDNLKLGSTTGDITLTALDTDIAKNFTLPRLVNSGWGSAYWPVPIGPVYGDTGTGATNFGYLYNFPTATAGETPSSLPATAGSANYSICPRGWRLPIFKTPSTLDDFSTLDRAFGGDGVMNYNGSQAVGKWQYGGIFKGTFAGAWVEADDEYVFSDTHSVGYYWTGSASPENGQHAYSMHIGTSSNEINIGEDRSRAYAVRCVLR